MFAEYILIFITSFSLCSFAEVCNVIMGFDFTCETNLKFSNITSTSSIPKWLRYNGLDGTFFGTAPSQKEFLAKRLETMFYFHVTSLKEGRKTELILILEEPIGNKAPIALYRSVFIPFMRFEIGVDFVDNFSCQLPSNLFYDPDRNSLKFKISGDGGILRLTNNTIFAKNISRSEAMILSGVERSHNETEILGYLPFMITATDPFMAEVTFNLKITFVFIFSGSSVPIQESLSSVLPVPQSLVFSAGQKSSLSLIPLEKFKFRPETLKIYSYPVFKSFDIMNSILDVIKSNFELTYSPSLEDVGDWVIYISLDEFNFLQFNVTVLFDIFSVQVDSEGLKQFGGSMINNFFLPSVQKQIVGRLPDISIPVNNSLYFEYVIPGSVFTQVYTFGLPLAIIEPAVGTDKIFKWIEICYNETNTFTSNLIIFGEFENSAKSQELVLTINLAGEDYQKTLKQVSFSFLVDLIVFGKMLPNISLKSNLSDLSIQPGSNFSWSIVSNLRQFPSGQLNFSLETFPEQNWLNFDRGFMSLEGSPSNETNLTAIVVATDQYGSSSFIQLTITILPSNSTSSDPHSTTNNGNTNLLQVLEILLGIIIFLILIAVIALILRKRFNLRRLPEKDSFVNNDKEHNSLIRKLEQIEFDFPKRARDFNEDSYASYRSFGQILNFHVDTNSDLSEYDKIIVKADVGRAFYFNYPSSRLIKKVKGGEFDEERTKPEANEDAENEINVSDSISYSYIKNAPKGYDLEEEIVEASYLSLNENSIEIRKSKVNERPITHVFVKPVSSKSSSLVIQTISDSSDDPNFIRFAARLWPTKKPLPKWLHFNPTKCSFFGIPYVSDVSKFEVEIVAARWAVDELGDKGIIMVYAKERFVMEVVKKNSK